MAFQPPREEPGKEDRKTLFLFSGRRQFKYSDEVVLSISGEGSSFGGLSQGWSLYWGNSQGRELGMEFPGKHSRLFSYIDASSWGEALTQHSVILFWIPEHVISLY